MDVRVVGQGRTPGMEYGGYADMRTQVLGIDGNRQQGLSRGLE